MSVIFPRLRQVFLSSLKFDRNFSHSAVWSSSPDVHAFRVCSSNECTGDLLGGLLLQLRRLRELGDRACRQTLCRRFMISPLSTMPKERADD